MNRIVFLLFLVSNYLSAQNVSTSDCLGAIPVCQQIYSETESPEGGGAVNEINSSFNCMQTEQNSVWYSFTVNNSGDFGFLLTPNNSNDDYDWALFDITNASCEELYGNQDLIVSCNAAGGPGCSGLTGANGETEYNLQGFNCDYLPPDLAHGYSPFNALIPVEAGNTYVLCVSNWSGSPNGYTIDFGLSTDIGIYDEIRPEMEQVLFSEHCDTASFTIEFSEYIQCSTISAQNFQLTGPGAPYNMELSSANCNAGGNFDKVFVLNISPGIALGDFTLSLVVDEQTEALDLCGNAALAAWDTIAVNYISEMPQIDLGNDTSLCPGESLLFNLADTLIDSIYWQDGNTGAEYEIFEDGLYSVSISSSCGELSDSIEVIFMPEINANILSDTFLCPGETLQLDISGSSATQYELHDSSGDPLNAIEGPGKYSVTLSNVCESVSFVLNVEECEICDVFIPNAFSPNNDGINDYFKPYSDCELSDFNLKIFNRWGAILCESSDPLKGWDGKTKGKLSDTGIYAWVMVFTVMENNKARNVRLGGDLMLLK
jgi:gliding motility-associated-like protein